MLCKSVIPPSSASSNPRFLPSSSPPTLLHFSLPPSTLPLSYCSLGFASFSRLFREFCFSRRSVSSFLSFFGFLLVSTVRLFHHRHALPCSAMPCPALPSPLHTSPCQIGLSIKAHHQRHTISLGRNAVIIDECAVRRDQPRRAHALLQHGYTAQSFPVRFAHITHHASTNLVRIVVQGVVCDFAVTGRLWSAGVNRSQSTLQSWTETAGNGQRNLHPGLNG